MTLNLDTRVGDLVLDHPQALRYLESQGVDYCCGGHRSLREACQVAERDPGTVLAALVALPAAAPEALSPKVWLDKSLRELTEHIEASHHAYLRAELPRLGALMEKVLKAHGANHPELEQVFGLFRALAADLMPHLLKEEQILFPFIRQMEAGGAAEACFASVQSPIRVMEHEHDAVGAMLKELRDVTSGYQAPADGCASYRALYDGLQGLEADTHLHIYLENQLLHPRALMLEASLRG